MVRTRRAPSSLDAPARKALRAPLSIPGLPPSVTTMQGSTTGGPLHAPIHDSCGLVTGRKVLPHLGGVSPSCPLARGARSGRFGADACPADDESTGLPSVWGKSSLCRRGGAHFWVRPRRLALAAACPIGLACLEGLSLYRSPQMRVFPPRQRPYFVKGCTR